MPDSVEVRVGDVCIHVVLQEYIESRLQCDQPLWGYMVHSDPSVFGSGDELVELFELLAAISPRKSRSHNLCALIANTTRSTKEAVVARFRRVEHVYGMAKKFSVGLHSAGKYLAPTGCY